MEEIRIIYEDSDVAVLNKPAGLVVHPAAGFSGRTLVDWLIEKYPDIKNVGEHGVTPGGGEVLRSGIVHRLDKDTSGVMIVAKNQKTHAFLKEQFQKREVRKTYQALVYGSFKETHGEIATPIGRSASDPRLRVASRSARGVLRDALTAYKVLQSFKGYTLIEAYPKTGRMHQIRVHFKSIGHPVVCDAQYAPGRPCPPVPNRYVRAGPPPAHRQLLHASSLEVMLPAGGRTKFEADLPDDFRRTLENLG
jgi:23S rRNA pseudouridine1911/1915/1917 synthase